jgi:hypothetical protein
MRMAAILLSLLELVNGLFGAINRGKDHRLVQRMECADGGTGEMLVSHAAARG